MIIPWDPKLHPVKGAPKFSREGNAFQTEPSSEITSQSNAWSLKREILHNQSFHYAPYMEENNDSWPKRGTHVGKSTMTHIN